MALTDQELEKIQDETLANYLSGAQEIRHGDRMIRMHDPDKVKTVIEDLEARRRAATGQPTRRRIRIYVSNGL